MSMSREQAVSAALVELADTLVVDFDIADFLHTLALRCVELLDVHAAGVMVIDHHGHLRVMASSSERVHLVELFEVETDEGPCVECFATGQPVSDTDLRLVDSRWARFSHRAGEAGFAAVHAVPMRLRDEVIGVLNLFSMQSGSLTDGDAFLGRALANVTTIGLLQQRAIHDGQMVVEQLQGALNSRVVIEQAKGVLFERLKLDMHDAFGTLRSYARRTNRRLSDVARDVIDDRMDTAVLLPSD
ncbi:MAG TPA: GAF and ANTAR domain-containing protein [Luteimonas sp.]|nr:GAF and ANTAR domain-containing protein [Luteimonas sp.]